MKEGHGPDPAISKLAIVRIAILAGILVFGGIIWFLQRDPGWVPVTPQFPV